MTLVMPSGGESLSLDYLTGKVTSVENLVLRLFSNDKTPAKGDVVGDYTEVSGSGYSAKTLTGASWSRLSPRSGSDGVGNNTTTFTSSSASFVSSDKGRVIVIGVVAYEIMTVTNSTTIVLSASLANGTNLAWRIPSTHTYAEQTFTFTGAAGNIYGYYYTRASTGDIVVAERFIDGAYNVSGSGVSILITPNISHY